jgi:hypothetical protein
MRKMTSIEVELDTTISSYSEEEKPELVRRWPDEYEGDSRVPEDVRLKRPMGKKHLEELETSKIEHFNFVGGCSDVFASRVPEALGTGGLSILALH